MTFEELPKIRTILYVVGLIASVASVFVAVTHPEYGEAFAAAAGIITTAMGATALSNLTPKQAPVTDVIEPDDGALEFDETTVFDTEVEDPFEGDAPGKYGA